MWEIQIKIENNGINNICPISIPTLKKSNERSIFSFAIPISFNAPAKPNPCNRPKLNARVRLESKLELVDCKSW